MPIVEYCIVSADSSLKSKMLVDFLNEEVLGVYTKYVYRGNYLIPKVSLLLLRRVKGNLSVKVSSTHVSLVWLNKCGERGK